MSARGLGDLGRWLFTGEQRGAVNLSLGPGWSAVRPQIVIAFFVALANAAIFVGFTGPAWRASSEAGSTVRLGAQAHDSLEPALMRARRSYGKVIEAEVGLAELRARVAERSGTASEVASTLRAAIEAAGLDAERVRYVPQEVPELGLLQMQVELPVRGSYRQMRRLLEELLDGPEFVVLERVAISTETADADGSLRVSLRASVFLDSTAGQGVAADSELPARARSSNTDPVALARQLGQRLASLPAIPLPPEEFELDVARLDAPRPQSRPVRRNPFAFAGSAARTPAVTPAERPEESEPAGPPEPLMPYTLLGITRTDEALLATLSDGDHVHVLREGESLPEGYRVLEVDLVSVRLEAGSEIVRLSLRNDEAMQPELGPEDGSQRQRNRRNKKSRGNR